MNITDTDEECNTSQAILLSKIDFLELQITTRKIRIHEFELQELNLEVELQEARQKRRKYEEVPI